jgi:hypothetical protein
MLDQVVDQVVDHCIAYCSNMSEDKRQALEHKLMMPLERYLAARFSWISHMFQAIAVIVLLQTAILIYLLLRLVRHQ